MDKFLAERRANMSVVLVPKQGFTYAYKSDVAATSGRSSGR